MEWDCPERDTLTNAAGQPVRVLNVHNYHAQRGGYDVFYEAVTDILRDRGHHVVTYDLDSADIESAGDKLRALGRAVYSKQSRRRVAEVIAAEKIDLVHLHNILPLVSPSVIDACLAAGVPVVMSIEDFKLTCPAGQHLRHGKVCTKCLGTTGKEMWCAVHGCRQNRVWSTAYAIRNIVNNMRGIFHRIDLMLPCSQFNADILKQDGYADEQIHVLPNFSPLAEEPAGDITKGTYAAYVGRISPEKGLPVLIEAARASGLPVKIAGDASEIPELVASAPGNVEFVGKLSREGVADFFRKARLAVVPSVWYECFGIVAAEAQGYGVPVLASRIGGLQETITDGETGLLFEAGSAEELASRMTALWHDEPRLRSMSSAARSRAQKHFTRDVFYHRLMAGYERATQRCARRGGRAETTLTKAPTPQAV